MSEDEQGAGAGYGSLGEEALRFVSAVQDWAGRTFPASDAGSSAGADGHVHNDCQWCPICQFMAVVRGERPDVTERVAEAGTALVSAFRAFVDAAAPYPDDAGAPGDRSSRPRVQRIDLGTDEPDEAQ